MGFENVLNSIAYQYIINTSNFKSTSFAYYKFGYIIFKKNFLELLKLNIGELFLW